MDISGKYQAFFVAMQQERFDEAIKQLLLYEPESYLCAGEVTNHGHDETQGYHMHYFCTITDHQYRAYIAKLKSLGFNMRGRAEPGLPRTYGKVKIVRDNLKMAAYTLKSAGTNTLMWTNFSDQLISHLLSISYLKEEKEDLSPLFTFINENLFREEERISLLPYNSLEGMPYCLNEPHMQLKVCILRYFKINVEKAPTRNRVNYLATRWALKESNWDLDAVCYYFYR